MDYGLGERHAHFRFRCLQVANSDQGWILTQTTAARMAAPLLTTKEWAALDAHYKEAKELHMRTLFEEEPKRFENFR